ncbi:MAG: ABC transporter permease [Proteobacteria bacterium]|nr:ABC transporter permease [Pseudomonadota bacterium]
MRAEGNILLPVFAAASRSALLLPPLALLVLFFLTPLLYLFFVSFHAPSQSDLFGEGLTLGNYLRVIGDSFFLTIIERTMLTGALVALICLAIGYPAAFAIARMPPRHRLVALLLLLFPLMVSNVIRAYGWVAILGRRGVINSTLRNFGVIDLPLDLMFSTATVAVGLLTILLPYMIISLANSIAAIDPHYEEAAQSLRASPVRTFFHVTLPLSAPGMTSGLMIVFLLTLSAYVTVSLLGGPRTKMLVSLVFDSVVAFAWPRAAAFAFILLALALGVALIVPAVLRPGRVRGLG